MRESQGAVSFYGLDKIDDPILAENRKLTFLSQNQDTLAKMYEDYIVSLENQVKLLEEYIELLELQISTQQEIIGRALLPGATGMQGAN